VRTYWEKFQNRYYVAGDSAHRDKDGYYWIMGRIDDVLNVAGHRLGTMEIESALVAHPRVAEAAVVGKQHEIKGESVFAYVVLKGQRPMGAEAVALTEELRKWVGEQLGAIAKPDDVRLTDNLPKTRSGKIMRRLLRSIARGEEILQDVSTLENPAIIDQLRGDGAPTVVSKQTTKPAGVPAEKRATRAAKKKALRRTAPARARAKPAKRATPSAKRGKMKRAKRTAKRATVATKRVKASVRSRPKAKAKRKVARARKHK
jgi:hypothetical protein